MARRLKARLRLVTRDVDSDPGRRGGFSGAPDRVGWSDRFRSICHPAISGPVPLGDKDDLVLATSWQTPRAPLLDL